MLSMSFSLSSSVPVRLTNNILLPFNNDLSKGTLLSSAAATKETASFELQYNITESSHPTWFDTIVLDFLSALSS